MAKLDWQTFHGSHRTSHFVRIVPTDEESSPVMPLRELQLAIARLIRDRLRPSGPYTLTISRETGTSEIVCAFVEQQEANLLATAIPGEPIETPSGHRLITLPRQGYEELIKRAGRPRRSARRSRTDASI